MWVAGTVFSARASLACVALVYLRTMWVVRTEKRSDSLVVVVVVVVVVLPYFR